MIAEGPGCWWVASQIRNDLPGQHGAPSADHYRITKLGPAGTHPTRTGPETHGSAADRVVEVAGASKANLGPLLRTSALRALPAQVLVAGHTSSNRSKTTPISSENVRPSAAH